MKGKKNITKIIRYPLRSTTESIEAKEQADKLLSEIYTDDKYEIKRRKGIRTIIKRNKFRLPYFPEIKRDESSCGFCAVYKWEGRIKDYCQFLIWNSLVLRALQHRPNL